MVWRCDADIVSGTRENPRAMAAEFLLHIGRDPRTPGTRAGPARADRARRRESAESERLRRSAARTPLAGHGPAPEGPRAVASDRRGGLSPAADPSVPRRDDYPCARSVLPRAPVTSARPESRPRSSKAILCCRRYPYQKSRQQTPPAGRSPLPFVIFASVVSLYP